MKGGATLERIIETARMLKEKGMTAREVIAEVETTLRGELPEQIKAIIRKEYN